MVLLFRFYGLRVSDVATLKKERIKGDYIFLHALKNGAPIWLPLYPEVKRALNNLIQPQGTIGECEYFFWSGRGSREEHIKTVTRTLKAMFRASGVRDAHPHRFRDTLATEILIKGGTVEDCANILGDSPEIIRKHYAKWSPEYQCRTVDILDLVHGTYTARENCELVSRYMQQINLVSVVDLNKKRPLRTKRLLIQKEQEALM